MLIIFILYSFLLKYLINCAHIYALDPELEFQNSGYAEYLKIPFSLESGF